MLKNYFIEITKNAINEAINSQELGETKENTIELICDKPKNKDFGDFAINVSALARTAKMAPPIIAQTITKHIKQEHFTINVVAGFINFKLEKEFLNKIIVDILEKKNDYLYFRKSSIVINLLSISARDICSFSISFSPSLGVSNVL